MLGEFGLNLPSGSGEEDDKVRISTMTSSQNVANEKEFFKKNPKDL